MKSMEGIFTGLSANQLNFFKIGFAMKHELVLVHQSDKFAEWECPVCHRYIRLGKEGSGLKVLNPGEQEINHGSASTVSGLKMGQAAVDLTGTH
jgi:hypothetical protein